MPIQVATIELHTGDTPVLRFQIVRKRAGVVLGAVGKSDLSALTLTHKNVSDGSIINNRNGQNALNLNNVTVDEDGWVEWAMQSADNPIVSTVLKAGEYEDHISKFVATTKDGLKSTRYIRTRVMKEM